MLFLNKPINKIIILNLIINSLMLFHNGPFIDDWKLYNQTPDHIIANFYSEGWYYTGIWLIHQFQFSFSNPLLASHILMMAMQSLTFFLFYKILRFTSLPHNLILWIVLLSAVSPFYIVRFLPINLPYTFSLFLFLLAYWILLRNHQQHYKYLGLLSGILLIYSFVTNSILFLYPALILHLWLLMNKDTPAFLKKYYWLIILPIVFMILRFTVFVPMAGGPDSDYNSIDMANIKLIPKNIIDLNIGFLKFMLFQVKSYWLLFGLVFLFSSIIIFSNKKWLVLDMSLNKKLFLISIGFSLFILAILPYLMVGKMPMFIYWRERHQLLIPFGYSILVVALIFLVKNNLLKTLGFGLVISVFITCTFGQMINKYNAWFKNESVYVFFKNNPLSPEVNTYKVIDTDKCTNATDRGLNWFVLSGLYKKATQKEDKFFVSINLLKLDSTGLEEHIRLRKKVNLMGPYNMTQFDHIKGVGTISVTCIKALSFVDILKFMKLYYTTDEKNLEIMYNSFFTIKIE
jgi:hypothetical protein